MKTEGAGNVKQEPGEGGPREPRPRDRTLTFNLSDSSAAEAEGPDAAAKAELDFDQLLGNCKFAMDRGAIHSTDSNNVFTLHYWAKKAAAQVVAHGGGAGDPKAAPHGGADDPKAAPGAGAATGALAALGAPAAPGASHSHQTRIILEFVPSTLQTLC